MKYLRFFFSFVLLIGLPLILATQARAQGGDTPPGYYGIENDLSQRLGKKLDNSNRTYTWERNNYSDASLGCPRPGVDYPKGQFPGYKIVITVDKTAKYEYRSYENGKFFMCGEGAPPYVAPPTPVPPTDVPPTVGPTATPVPQPTTYEQPVAYIGVDGNVYISSLGINPGPTPLTSNATREEGTNLSRRYIHLRWSPDGTQVAFLEGLSGILYVAKSGQKTVPVSVLTYNSMPPAWSPDGERLAFAIPEGESSEKGTPFSIYAISAQGKGLTKVGQFTAQLGCGGLYGDPADAAYYEETGYFGNPYQFVWTSRGFVHATFCANVGFALTDLDGKTLWEVPDVGHLAISPDNKFAVGIKGAPPVQVQPEEALKFSELTLIDLSSGQQTALKTQPGLDQAAFSADGNTVFYSTLSKPQANSNGAYVKFEVTLWQMPVKGGQSTKLASHSARGIAMITPLSDGSAVLYSLVPSSDPVYPHPHVFRLALPDGKPSELFPAAWYFTPGRSAAFTAVPRADSPDAGFVNFDNPYVDETVIVKTVYGDTLNLRAKADPNAAILRKMEDGTRAKVVGGPQIVAGYRWWQIQTEDDHQTGWAVERTIEKDEAVQTLVVENR